MPSPLQCRRRQCCHRWRRSAPGENLDETVAVQALQSRIVDVYKAVSPSVVNITNRGYAYSIFGRVIPQEGSGSGFVYDARGHIVTNYHVIENAEELLVTFSDGECTRPKLSARIR